MHRKPQAATCVSIYVYLKGGGIFFAYTSVCVCVCVCVSGKKTGIFIHPLCACVHFLCRYMHCTLIRVHPVAPPHFMGVILPCVCVHISVLVMLNECECMSFIIKLEHHLVQ